MCPQLQPCLVLAGSGAVWWMWQYASVASLVNRLFDSSSELQITSIQIKMIALQQRHGSILCMCYFQGAIVLWCSELPQLSATTLPEGLNFSPCSSFTLFVTLKSPLWWSQDPLTNQGGLKTGSTRTLCSVCTFCTHIFFLTIVVLIYNSFCRQYCLCQFGNFSQRFTPLLMSQRL